jgi:hypothetical protein
VQTEPLKLVKNDEILVSLNVERAGPIMGGIRVARPVRKSMSGAKENRK